MEAEAALRGLPEKGADTSFLCEMTGFAAERLTALGAGGMRGDRPW